MTLPLNKVTGKFWSFKDTKHYKKANYNLLCNDDAVRTFVFEKSYLIQIYKSIKDEYFIVVPLHFRTNSFPNGSYCGLTSDNEKIYFTDKDIIRVLG